MTCSGNLVARIYEYLEEGGAQDKIATLNSQYQAWTSHFTHSYVNIRVSIKLAYQSSDLEYVVAATLGCPDSFSSSGVGRYCHKRRLPRLFRLCVRSVRMPSTMGCNLVLMWSLEFALL